jgi:hypothetical protein
MMTAAPDDDDAYTSLSRHLYWGAEPGRHGEGSAQVREAMLEFVAKMRTDERARIPLGEPHLSATSTWRRKLKRQLWMGTRFSSRRYDRLLGDAVDLSVSLSERVIDLEHEVEGLKARLAETEGPVP